MRIRLPKTGAAVALLALAGCGTPAVESAPWRSGTGVARWRVEVADASLRVDPQIVAVGPKDVWAFGGHGPDDTVWRPTARHWNGHDWTKVALPGGRIGAVKAAGASAASDVWAVALGGSDSTVLHWNGERWTVDRRLPGFTVTAMDVFSPQDVRVYGTGSRAAGAAWTRSADGWSETGLPFRIARTSARSARDIWALTFENKLYHQDGAGWRPVPLDDVLPSEKRTGHEDTRYRLGTITATAAGVWITAEGAGDVPAAETDGTRTEPMGPNDLRLSSLLLHGDADGRRWTSESLMEKTGRLSPFGAPIIDADGGVWLIGSTDVNAYESALAHRTAKGTWTSTKIRASGFSLFEARAITRIPGTTRFLAAGMDDEKGALLSTP
ncbi:hypothetical protein GCM10010402_21240 [Actinomadura luteofluorescens]|uniref:hypothetical protein n=1 Tax=Actinomadura luteofluorescens TaxID=46163 RepID=UPI002164B377|nr:hypothetical protein [Actinomadura glauciflava]MCR3745264.1 hypothetical protein [Actinomadura glauciflava]